MYPHIPLLINHLTEDDPNHRLKWCERFNEMCEEELDLVDRIIWSDEAWFTLNGHNCVYWYQTNPHLEIDVKMNPQKVMVWAGVWSTGRVGPFFFDQTVNGVVYLDLLENHVFLAIGDRLETDRFIFQEDGAPAHYAASFQDRLAFCRHLGGETFKNFETERKASTLERRENMGGEEDP